MPFDVHGDKIIFDGYPIAQFTDAPWLGLRIECENLLKNLPDFEEVYTEEEYHQGIADAETETEERVKDELNEKHEKDLETATEEGREAGHEAGFREGRTDALEAAGKAADVFRVDALLTALEAAENALRAPLNGVLDEGKRRPVKLAELKDEVRKIVHLLASARVEYVKG